MSPAWHTINHIAKVAGPSLHKIAAKRLLSSLLLQSPRSAMKLLGSQGSQSMAWQRTVPMVAGAPTAPLLPRPAANLLPGSALGFCSHRSLHGHGRSSIVAPAASAASSDGTKGARKAQPARPKSSTSIRGQPIKTVPGLGDKYAKLMKMENVHTVGDLMDLHAQIVREGKRIEEVLQERFQITHAGHLQTICKYLEEKAQDEQQVAQPAQAALASPESSSWLRPKVTLSVEGNISAGKSTFLRILEQSGILEHKLQVVPEPVDKWQNVGKGKVNLLMEFYKAPERFAYTFQNYVFLTRVVQERESYTSPEMNRLLERSVFSDRMVFVRAVHAANYMNDTELAIYDSWFDPVLSTLPTLVPNGFIYLRASPETCHLRLKKRAREEETSVKLEYLRELHECHEDWLFMGGESLPATVPTDPSTHRYLWLPMDEASRRSARGSSAFAITDSPIGVQGEQGVCVPLPPVPRQLGGLIRFLDVSKGAHMHPQLDMIPAMVLDCDTDVDVERDESYRRDIATKVELYSDYVRDVMLSRGEALLRLEQLQQQHSQASASSSSISSSSSVVFGTAGRDGSGQAGAAGFNGYHLNFRGTTVYVDKDAPLLAYATEALGGKSSAGGDAAKGASAAAANTYGSGQQQQQQQAKDASSEDGRPKMAVS